MAPKHIVTDHAVIRYLERVYGVDVLGLKNRIAKVTEEARDLGAGAVNCDGVHYVMSKSGRVITVRGTQAILAKRALRWKRRRK